jgi:hypothetical protein
MKGLSDIHPISRYDLMVNRNPLSKVISNKLDVELNIPEKEMPTYCPSEPQCGNISVNWKESEVSDVMKGLFFEDFTEHKLRTFMKKLQKKVDSYMEKKCKEYCKKNHLPIEAWRGFAVAEYQGIIGGYKWEIRHNGDIVCGVKVTTKITGS